MFWQLKAAANLSLFGLSNTNKVIFGVNYFEYPRRILLEGITDTPIVVVFFIYEYYSYV